MPGDKKELNLDHLVSAYVRTAWILKIRMISGRRQLWAKEVSKIHIENAALQIRMACECIGSMCLLLAELQGKQVSSKLKKRYEPGKVFSALMKIDALNFPNSMRIEESSKSHGPKKTWTMEIHKHSDGDISDVKKIWDFAGEFLHEASPFKRHPLNSDSGKQYILAALEEWKRHHQWLWNRFWCHAVRIEEGFFCIDLQSTSETTCPRAILMDGFIGGDIEVNFDPQALADFNDDLITWRE